MEFNVNPYYDDFEQNAKDNNYLKILFQPGRSVQARELTQIQSILQNQIKSFGDHIFQDGSPVIGGNLTLDNKITFLKLEETFNSEDIELDDFVGKIILRDPDGVVQAKVLASYYPSGGTPTILVKYISGAEFQNGDTFKVAGTLTKAKCVASNSSGSGTVVSINEGIFYVNGYFVTVNPQTAVVEAYGQNANVKIGLEISDDVVDYAVDSTLLDPAQGSFNYQAPGADRYQFNLNLSTRPLATAVDESSFFELMRVENGAITKQVKYPIYSEIEKTLARRTYDESGDYTVNPFTATVSASPDIDKYLINIDPGKAYVKGFEFETIGTFKLEADKPRSEADIRSLVDIDVDTSFGNYIIFKNFNANSALNIASIERVDLHCVTANSVNIGIGSAANTSAYANTKMGTARIRSVQRDRYSIDVNDTNLDGNGTYKIYLTDVNIKPRIIRVTAATASSQSINLGSYASEISGAYDNVAITILPISLTPDSNGIIDTVYQNQTRANANVSSDFNEAFNVGDIIRVGSDVRQVYSINTAGDFLTVNSAFSETITGEVQAYKQLTYTSNVTGQTRVITNYVGMNKVAMLDRSFDNGAIAAPGTVVQLNFGIKDLESFVEANGTSSANAWANVALNSKLINGDTEPFDSLDRALIFKLPKNYVKYSTLDNIDYVQTKYIEGINGSVGVFEVTVEASYETIPWSITNSNIEQNLIAVVKASNGATPANTILKLTTAEVSKLLDNKIQIATGDPDISALDVYINVKHNDAENRIRTKAFRSNTTYTLSPFTYPDDTAGNLTVNVPNVGNSAKISNTNGLVFITDPSLTQIGPGDSINLYVPDVVRVRKILKGNTSSVATSDNYQDITDHFYVDYGQSDELYEHAKLILKQGYPSPNAKLTVHLDFYEHTYPAGASYFCADSYEQSIYESGEIPVFVSSKTGTYLLRDCLDFRPTRQIGYADGRLQVGTLPSPDSSTELSYDYYLPRIDKLVLGKNKEFKIIKGTSSPAPVPPEDDTDSMTLYTIYLTPYVASTKEIRLKYNENKRYTMSDIAKLDKRIKAVEYYTALNNIERQAMNDSTKYLTDGTDKEKLGIIGEGFTNYNIADYKNPDFTVALYPYTMLPETINRVNSLKVVGLTNVKENEKTITLNYTETPAIVQDVTSDKSIIVQPFLFATFIGEVNLTPEIDSWVSEELKPEIIRGPEAVQVKQINNIVTETKNPQVIADRIVEKAIINNNTPTSNAATVISENSGSLPPARDEDEDLPVEVAAVPPVITPDPTSTVVIAEEKPTPAIDPIVYYPIYGEVGGYYTSSYTEDIWIPNYDIVWYEDQYGNKYNSIPV